MHEDHTVYRVLGVLDTCVLRGVAVSQEDLQNQRSGTNLQTSPIFVLLDFIRIMRKKDECRNWAGSEFLLTHSDSSCFFKKCIYLF